ncbi:MAG: excalibur calcium-binding domain-containing protein [Idiomarina sp.]
MSEGIFYVGLGIFIIGGIGLLISAFRVSVFWVLAILLIPPLAIVYVIVHWQDAKGPFKIQIFGILVIAIFAYMNGGLSSVTTAAPDFTNLRFSEPVSSSLSDPYVSDKRFRCDGRTYCSQMTSCEEATYFVKHCPNTKMDGNHDGVPCERQWCK